MPQTPVLSEVFNTVSRRHLLCGVAACASWGALAPSSHAQGAKEALSAEKWQEMLKPGPMGDHVLGSADAPITIVEYASLTCIHCKNFHDQVMPKLKEKYIETGKVRFIFREVAYDALALAGFMLANCSGDKMYYPVLGALFSSMEDWARSNDPAKALLQVVKQAGFTQESFETCLRNKELQDKVSAVGQRAQENFGVNSTPAFFINGTMQRGASSFEEFETLILSKMPPQK